MPSTVRIIGILIFALLGAYTSSKLWRMAQIRGFVSGPAPVTKTITSKAVIPGDYSDGHWVAWDRASVRRPGSNRISLPRDIWERLNVGDTIEVLYFPRHRWPYYRDDIFASNENFAFDFVFLAGWLTGVLTLSYHEIRARKRKRRRLPPPLPA